MPVNKILPTKLIKVIIIYIKSFTKVVKVVFIKDVSIPAILNSETIFLEGLMSLSSVDSERDVKHSLTEIINRHSGSSGLREEDLSYLTCSHKRLSYPCVPLTFEWNGMGLKTIIGQGKLYVKVSIHDKDFQRTDMDQSLTPSRSVTDSEMDLPDLLMTASTLDAVHSKMDDLSSLLSVAGCFRPVQTLLNRDNLVTDLIRFFVLERVYLPMEQLKSGLRTLHLLETMEAHPETLEELFKHNEDEKLTADAFEAIYVDIKYSTVGSNRRATEERIIGYWRDFIMDVEEATDVEGLTLANLLVFGTGADVVPPLGFDPPPSIEFLHYQKELDSYQAPYPKANTCSMVLRLPIVDSYDQFKQNMVFGTRNSQGFGYS